MKFISSSKTDIGRKRKTNQDSFGTDPSNQLHVLADGMGGHAGGEYASKVCVEQIIQSIQEKNPKSTDPKEWISKAIVHAGNVIFKKGQEEKTLQGMGTTVDTLLFQKDMLYIGHVGDSRVYLIRNGLIWQLTHDHSLVNEKFRSGLISREQMETDPNKNVITRSVGFESIVEVDVYTKKVAPGDLYLACSDGLNSMLKDKEILALVEKTEETATPSEENLSNMIDRLIESANNRGGLDNTTVVLVKAENYA